MTLEADLLELEQTTRNEDKIILDLCSGSGNWSKPYRDNGYTVIEVTWPDYDVRLYPSAPMSGTRLPDDFDDIRKHPTVHGILAAPPCTMFATSGAHAARSDHQIIEALSVVDACLRLIHVLRPTWWALENPVGKLTKWIGQPIFKFSPSDYGEDYNKETWLWGDFNIPDFKSPTVTAVSLCDTIRNPIGRAVTSLKFAEAFYEANQ